jgi:hypothetical protein
LVKNSKTKNANPRKIEEPLATVLLGSYPSTFLEVFGLLGDLHFLIPQKTINP